MSNNLKDTSKNNFGLIKKTMFSLTKKIILVWSKSIFSWSKY